ncbi:MAG: DUF2283 domain-containing protein [Desulfurococcales archaeon]|jgi:uncharacterized protein YuzE|nr:DUF2283 domain-containing protein [Desulfurococcales archaeon]
MEYKIKNLDDIWIDYDRSADTLYINFGDEVEEADEAILVGEDIIVRIKNGEIVSITINNFSKRIGIEF